MKFACMAVSRMRNVSDHNYRNSSFIVDLAMGQIPRSKESISSLKMSLFISFVQLSTGLFQLSTQRTDAFIRRRINDNKAA